MQQKKKAFNKERTKELQETYQSYAKANVIIALLCGLLVIGTILYNWMVSN